MSDTEREEQGPDVEYDEQTGEVFPDEDETSLIDQVLDETELQSLQAHRKLDWKQIEEQSEGDSQKIGMHGWFVRVPASIDKTTKKKLRGSHLKGQIVAAGSTKNKFGNLQPYVVVYGKNTTPAYRNKQGNLIPALNGVEGRWMVGVDSTLLELPAHKGDIVELEFQKTGQGGQRNVWAKVNCWPVSY